MKRVKNSVIRNHLAKNAEFMRRCEARGRCVGRHRRDEIGVEAAHLITSLPCGSGSALETFLRLQTLRLLICSFSKFTGTHHLLLLSAEYGPLPETTGSMRIAKEALRLIFATETLDIPLPSPSRRLPSLQPPRPAPRIPHRIRPPPDNALLLFPPSNRIIGHATMSKLCGWEKIPSLPCASATSPIAGGSRWGRWSGEYCGDDMKLQKVSLLALVPLAKENAGVAVPLARGRTAYRHDPPLGFTHTLVRSRNVDVLLAACLYATHFLRTLHASPHAASTTHVFDYAAETTYAQVSFNDACGWGAFNIVNWVVAEGGGETVERRVNGRYAVMMASRLRPDTTLFRRRSNDAADSDDG
ncbi:hypothetical protein DFP72DRAFT_1064006 [Ephemerocybe angulata]|uniref:Uncharacterized protein n=1 Tax=Ephemerocybe angulata TaxID=980116 RepID=A0A8H6MC43_9AGAR|nr:hypothetical protein DFP72DRAFT_1064006 [Tulosesus angulatus]